MILDQSIPGVVCTLGVDFAARAGQGGRGGLSSKIWMLERNECTKQPLRYTALGHHLDQQGVSDPEDFLHTGWWYG